MAAETLSELTEETSFDQSALFMNSEISLLIPAYNSGERLAELLQDAVSQTVPFAEILVYDDSSADDTAMIAKNFGVRVLRGRKNRGAAFGRNRLIAVSRSEWLHFHDADDRLSVGFNKRMLEEKLSFDTCLVCAAKEVDVSTGEQISHLEWTGLNESADPVRFFLANQCAMIVGLYPRHLVTQIRGFREDLRGAEDYDFHVRLAQNGARFRAIPDVLATIMRRSGSSFTERSRPQYLLDYLKVLDGYAGSFSATYFRELGFVLMDLAWRLYEVGEMQAAKQAVGLARKMGRKRISSSFKLMRMLSGLLGPLRAFRIRSLMNSLSE